MTLSTATEGAEIYYTLDGTCPCVTENAARIKYTGPIVIREDTFIIAYAVKEGYKDSFTTGFVYHLKTGLEDEMELELVEKTSTATTVSLTKQTDGQLSGCLIIAAYDADGKQLGYNLKFCDFNPNEQINISVDYTGTVAKIKMFLLDSENKRPLYEASVVWPVNRT